MHPGFRLQGNDVPRLGRLLDILVSLHLRFVMTYDNALAALGDPTRRAIVGLLRRGPRSVGRLARALPVSRPAVSQHLKVLSEAGLVEVAAEGNRRIYALSPKGIAALRSALDALWEDALSAFEDRAMDFKEDDEMIEPIVKTLTLPVTAERAFSLFTTGIASWWPVATHSLSASAGALPIAVEIDGRRGGQIVETLHDGRREPWGTITEWQPGRRFSMTWHVGRPPESASQVTVTFESLSTGCKVTLVHDNWQNLGDQGPHLRENYQTGWDGVLAQYRDAA